ncbi:IclR family transcriptional regulator [Siminovitchia sp. FSL W7-1587]|uniref:IclR family transcriptional regulator n=1 Tax=Siminovitchia sp. FSL W7-1587 TaxID=2954699 RepID=UPI0030D34E44
MNIRKFSKKGEEMPEEQKRTSLENALHVLKLFSMDEPEMSVTDVSRKLQVAKSTSHRLLSSLASEGFVYKDPHTNLYSLGSSILSLVQIVNSQIPIANEAVPILNMLVETIGENAHLAILEGLDVVYLQTIDGVYSSVDYIHLGNRKPAFCTSAGQAILAFHPKTAARASRQLRTYAVNTITSPDAFFQKLKDVQKNGFVISEQEYRDGITGIGVPVYNDKKQVMASLSITALTQRVSSDRIKNRYVTLLQKASGKLTEMIIWRKRSDIK